MARRVYFSKSYLCNVERGKRRPTPAVIKAYREAFGVTDEGLLAPARRRRDRLAARREVVGHTQESLAEALDVAVSTVARWEQGVGRPLPSLRRPLADALAVSLDDLDRLLTGGDDSTPYTRGEEEDPTNRRDALKLGFALAAGALATETAPRLGAADVERLRAGVHSLYPLGAQHGGGAVLDRALAQLRAVRQLLSTAWYSSTTGRRLQVVTGELTEEAGLLAFDAGRQDTARQLFTESLCIAELAESAQLRTLVLGSMALQAAEYGDPRESVDLADAAQRAARPVATPRVASLVTARGALAYARSGESAPCGAALASAERLMDEGDDVEDPDWAAFWKQASFHETVARAHLLLGDCRRAVQAARAALDCAHPGHLRNEFLYRATLAQALVGAGEVDQAAAVASDVISRLGAVSSERVRDRLRAMRAPLEAHADVPGVGECIDQLARI